MPAQPKKVAKPAKSGARTKPAQYCVVIVELDTKLRANGQSKPHLYIGMSKTAPEARLKTLQGSRSAGPDYARGHYVKIYEASPYTKPRTSAAVARRRCDEQIEKYIRRGHFVNNGERFHVYVIDLKQDHLEIMPNKGHVYVGSTSKDVETRIEEHRVKRKSETDKKLNSNYVTNHMIGHNKKLSPAGHFFTRTSAEDAEEKLAEELCRKGYLVRAGQFTPNAKTCISKRKTKK
jgi:predicted GIY-YIG superfamily endonuclease